jgi:hypothetical protein
VKVAVYLRDEFDDEDRRRIGVAIDGDLDGERLAKRDEIKDFFSLHGEAWRGALNSLVPPREEEEPADDGPVQEELDLEDLI